ncbi:HEAT repeat domain-containing protein [bacterium]|nr:HEAT repeat domain-containing protein [bacterium]
MEEGFLNLEEITKECDAISPADIQVAVKNILSLDERYEAENLIKIYSHLLSVSQCPEVILTVISCSDRIRNKQILPALIDILLLKNINDNDSELKEKYINVRSTCAKAIANLKDTTAVSALLYCMNNKDENYKVRLSCADALGKIGDRFAVTPLINVISDEEEKSVYLKESAASALGLIGDLRAVDPLVSILEGQKGLWGKFTFLKERVIEALGKLRLDNNERVIKALKKSLMDDSAQIRINAIEALMESGGEDAFQAIRTCLVDNDDEVKKNALIALYNLRGREILDEVIKGDFCDNLKMEAVSLIEEYENEDTQGEDTDE